MSHSPNRLSCRTGRGPRGAPQKAPGLVERVAKGRETLPRTDEVEKVAMFPRRAVSPTPPGALAGKRALEPHIEAAARVVVHVADDPIIAAVATVRKIMLADGLDMLGEAAGQSPSGAFHDRLRLTN